MKTAFVGPSQGELTVIKHTRPDGYKITVDLLTPRIPQFVIDVPMDDRVSEEGLLPLAMDALREQIVVHMLGFRLDNEICLELSTSIMDTFNRIYSGDTVAEKTDAILDGLDADDGVELYREAMFQIPKLFVDEFYEKVVTAGQVVQRQPSPKELRYQLGFTEKSIPKDKQDNPAEVIRKYKEQIYKKVPGPLYVMVYNNTGKAVGISQITHGLTKWK